MFIKYGSVSWLTRILGAEATKKLLLAGMEAGHSKTEAPWVKDPAVYHKLSDRAS